MTRRRTKIYPKTILGYVLVLRQLCCHGPRFGNNLLNLSWEKVNHVFSQNDIDNILALIDPIRSLPTTSVVNETAFNQMKLIKTDRRHRLSSEHMNDMMLIRIQSPKVQEFDRTPSIDKWMAIFTLIML